MRLKKRGHIHIIIKTPNSHDLTSNLKSQILRASNICMCWIVWRPCLLIVLAKEGRSKHGYTLDDQSKKQVGWEPPGHPYFLPHFLHFLPPVGTQPPNPGWAGGLLYHMSSSPQTKTSTNSHQHFLLLLIKKALIYS